MEVPMALPFALKGAAPGRQGEELAGSDKDCGEIGFLSGSGVEDG